MRPVITNFEEDDRSYFDERENVEDQWEAAVLDAIKGDFYPVARLYWRGFRPPARPKAALDDLMARKEDNVGGRRPRYGKALWRKVAQERRLRERQDQKRREAYERHKADVMAETGRQRGVQAEAIDRAAADLAPDHQRTEVREIGRVLRGR
jgi:hypothetical protein